jgi:phosphoribosylanthranilate isomerase
MNARTGIKICGLTRADQAAACAEAGADAIGLVFHPASPRFLDAATAASVAAAVPAGVAIVGVFVDLPPAAILRLAREVGLTTVQLHGREPDAWVADLLDAGLHVVRVLAASGDELVRRAAALPAAAGVLVECGRGTLPGGNGVAWDWSGAAALRGRRDFAVAGGLTPENVAAALARSGAAAVDVSSGVESFPGCKDLALVRAFIAAARGAPPPAGTAAGTRVFGGKEQR